MPPVPEQEAPSFFPTIEDFLWFKLGLVLGAGRVSSVSFAGGSTGDSERGVCGGDVG